MALRLRQSPRFIDLPYLTGVPKISSSDSDWQLLVHGETSMDTGITMGSIREASPRFQARMAGIFAWIGTTEGFAIWVRSRLVVDSDAAATAHNILAHEMLYRWGFVGDALFPGCPSDC